MPNITHIVTQERFKYTVKIVTLDISDHSSQEMGYSNQNLPGELACMSKDCFFVGLLPKNCPMVVLLKDQHHTTPLDLLKVLLEQANNDALTCTHYPQSTSTRLNALPKPAECYHRQPPADKRNDRYTIHPTQLKAKLTEGMPEADAIFPSFFNDSDALETWYNDRFLIGLRQTTKISEYRNSWCSNFQKEGHCCHQCKELLSLELQELLNQQDKEHEE